MCDSLSNIQAFLHTAERNINTHKGGKQSEKPFICLSVYFHRETASQSCKIQNPEDDAQGCKQAIRDAAWKHNQMGWKQFTKEHIHHEILEHCGVWFGNYMRRADGIHPFGLWSVPSLSPSSPQVQ